MALVVYINAIERDVALIAARAIYRATTSVIIFNDICGIRSISRIHDARLEAEKVGHITRLKRELLNLSLTEGDPECSIDKIDGLALAADFHRFIAGADLQN
jgi:hypothetical protein